MHKAQLADLPKVTKRAGMTASTFAICRAVFRELESDRCSSCQMRGVTRGIVKGAFCTEIFHLCPRT